MAAFDIAVFVRLLDADHGGLQPVMSQQAQVARVVSPSWSTPTALVGGRRALIGLAEARYAAQFKERALQAALQTQERLTKTDARPFPV
jgi:hypothetical protein